MYINKDINFLQLIDSLFTGNVSPLNTAKFKPQVITVTACFIVF